MFNKSIIMGNLARDPENKKVGENQVTRLVVAVNDVVKKDKAHYVDVETWNKTAENCAKYLAKGRQVLVEGRLFQDIWEKDGKKNSKLYIKADNVQFLGGKKEAASAGASSSGDEEIPF
jgi:single-strand DNA-binding protein